MTAEPRPLSVIAVTHDSAEALPAWIEALEATGVRDSLELCVVDSGSGAEQLARTRELARGRVDVFVDLPNVGYGSASNAGAAATAGTNLLFTNPDSRILSMPRAALEPSGLGPLMLGGFGVEPTRPLAFARMPGLREEAQELVLGRYSKAFERAEQPAWISGAALMMSRASFDRIKGFSPAFFMYFEDADICARHRYAGGTVATDRTFQVSHGFGQSTEERRREELAAPLESIGRLSGRKFASRYGTPVDQPILYLLMLTVYLPKRALVDVLREGRPLRDFLAYAGLMLRPSKALAMLKGES